MKAVSQKQKLATQLLSQGFTARQAMIKAGYSKGTAGNPKKNLLSKPQVLTIVERIDYTLNQRGITPEYLGNKLADLAESDNAKTFIMGYDRIAKIKKIDQQPNQEPIKRQITLTEYLHTEPTVTVTTPIEDVTEQPKISDYTDTLLKETQQEQQELIM